MQAPRRYEQAEAPLASGRGLPGRPLVCPVEPQVRETPASQTRKFIGFDVNAWSVTADALDSSTGEVWQQRLTPDPEDVLGWVCRGRLDRRRWSTRPVRPDSAWPVTCVSAARGPCGGGAVAVAATSR